jgi:hypothetical protein
MKQIERNLFLVSWFPDCIRFVLVIRGEKSERLASLRRHYPHQVQGVSSYSFQVAGLSAIRLPRNLSREATSKLKRQKQKLQKTSRDVHNGRNGPLPG